MMVDQSIPTRWATTIDHSTELTAGPSVEIKAPINHRLDEIKYISENIGKWGSDEWGSLQHTEYIPADNTITIFGRKVYLLNIAYSFMDEFKEQFMSFAGSNAKRILDENYDIEWDNRKCCMSIIHKQRKEMLEIIKEDEEIIHDVEELQEWARKGYSATTEKRSKKKTRKIAKPKNHLEFLQKQAGIEVPIEESKGNKTRGKK